MSWWRRVFGLDGFDVAVQAVITAIILIWIGAVNRRGEDVVIFGSVATVTSLVILAVRRRLALNRVARLGSNEADAERLAELEQRVAELEFDHARLLELEERLDFAERLLAAPKDPVREIAP
jgi:ABC-type transport system involved in cytochrome bd biosynthesis fused ATPase/permease subunit